MVWKIIHLASRTIYPVLLEKLMGDIFSWETLPQNTVINLVKSIILVASFAQPPFAFTWQNVRRNSTKPTTNFYSPEIKEQEYSLYHTINSQNVAAVNFKKDTFVDCLIVQWHINIQRPSTKKYSSSKFAKKRERKEKKRKEKKKDFVAKFRADTSELVIYFILNKL